MAVLAIEMVGDLPVITAQSFGPRVMSHVKGRLAKNHFNGQGGKKSSDLAAGAD